MIRCLLLLVVCTVCGCQNMFPALHPGTTPAQQRRAALHDPFPDPTVAPEVQGGRPREFAVPFHEPIKNRSFADRHMPR